MTCKLIALTPRGYAANTWNLFDGFLVIVSIVDVVLSQSKLLTGSSLSVLRVFRLVSRHPTIFYLHLSTAILIIFRKLFNILYNFSAKSKTVVDVVFNIRLNTSVNFFLATFMRK